MSWASGASTTEVLNAKQHTREAHVVAQAGRLHGVTVATNMAGRGVDIKLGGDAEGLAEQAVITEGFTPDLLVDEFELPMPLEQMDEEYRTNRTAALARYDQLLAEFDETVPVGGRRGPRARRPVRARHGAPREPPHRQPVARPLRPPGRPG